MEEQEKNKKTKEKKYYYYCVKNVYTQKKRIKIEAIRKKINKEKIQ